MKRCSCFVFQFQAHEAEKRVQAERIEALREIVNSEDPRAFTHGNAHVTTPNNNNSGNNSASNIHHNEGVTADSATPSTPKNHVKNVISRYDETFFESVMTGFRISHDSQGLASGIWYPYYQSVGFQRALRATGMVMTAVCSDLGACPRALRISQMAHLVNQRGFKASKRNTGGKGENIEV